MLSRKHECCIRCGETEIKHASLGLCQKCYGRVKEARHTGYRGRAEKIKNTKLTGKKLGHLLTKEYSMRNIFLTKGRLVKLQRNADAPEHMFIGG